MEIEELEALDAAIGTLLREISVEGAPSEGLNARMRCLVRDHLGRDEDLDWAGCLVDAMSLIPYGGWFHWNHFAFAYVPTTVGMGVLSNGTDYLPDGRPVSFEAMAFDSARNRAALPRLVCEAVLRSWRAPLRKRMALSNARHYVVQTGGNPLMATPEGRLAPLDYRSYLTADGRLVPYDEKVHGDARIEAPDA